MSIPKARKKFTQRQSGEWIQPRMKSYYESCPLHLPIRLQEGDLERIELPPGVEFFHVGYQRIFPDVRVPDGASLYLLRRGLEDKIPEAFDGHEMQFGFHDVGHGWAYVCFAIKPGKTTIEIIREIEANIPALAGFRNA